MPWTRVPRVREPYGAPEGTCCPLWTLEHSCTTRLAVSDTYRVGHACRANLYEATGVSVHFDTAAILMAADTLISLFVTLRPDANAQIQPVRCKIVRRICAELLSR